MKPRSELADLVAAIGALRDARSTPRFLLAASGMRADGTRVFSFNGKATGRSWMSHAETRLCRKLDVGARVFVARTHRSGAWALARPCESCLRCLRRKGVVSVAYTVGPDEYGVLVL